MPTYIPLAKIEGKEPLLDYWEVCDDDVIAVSLSQSHDAKMYQILI